MSLAVLALLGLTLGASAASAPPEPAPQECPAGLLQSLVDEAAPGSTVNVPACLYRGTVTIGKPLTLRAQPGAEIRGADVWTAWNGRVSELTLPAVQACVFGAPGCVSREAVLLDGRPLVRVPTGPKGGQFAIDPTRHVVLGESPVGRTVEVVVRPVWMRIAASNVTVAGFTMRYASNAAQTGALQVDRGVSNVVMRDLDLSYAGGAAVAFGGANDSRLVSSAIHDNGQLGVHLGGDGAGNGRNNRVVGSHIYRNNTAGFDKEWEAGGLKATVQSGLVLDGNEVDHNDGAGLWCDIYCSNIVVSNNRVHDNTYPGIWFEVSTGAHIYGNAAWNNGTQKAVWGWGAGILISSSGGADVHDNVLAWNSVAGVAVISQRRTDWPNAQPTNNSVHHNVIVARYDTWLMFWAQDWAGPMFNPASNNRGSANRYWIGYPEDGRWRFTWDDDGNLGSLSAFNATPGEEGATYLSDADKNAVLAAAGIPTSP